MCTSGCFSEMRKSEKRAKLKGVGAGFGVWVWELGGFGGAKTEICEF